MKSVDRLKGTTDERVIACILARDREADEMQRALDNARDTTGRIGWALTEAHPDNSLEGNRALFTSAERYLTDLRQQITRIRRIAKQIADRDEREMNGRFIP